MSCLCTVLPSDNITMQDTGPVALWMVPGIHFCLDAVKSCSYIHWFTFSEHSVCYHESIFASVDYFPLLLLNLAWASPARIITISPSTILLVQLLWMNVELFDTWIKTWLVLSHWTSCMVSDVTLFKYLDSHFYQTITWRVIGCYTDVLGTFWSI